MRIHLSDDGVPVFRQIGDAIRQRIGAGTLSAGDAVPPIRQLAETLRVNPNTVARAYRELQRDGLLENRRTRGTFVTDAATRAPATQRKRELTPAIDSLLTHARALGVDDETLDELIRQRRRKLPDESEGKDGQ